MPPMSLPPDQSKKTSAPGSGFLDHAPRASNQRAWEGVQANWPTKSSTPAFPAAQAMTMSHQGAVRYWESFTTLVAYHWPNVVCWPGCSL